MKPPFNQATDLWQKLGADGFGRDAQEAINAAVALVAAAATTS